MSQPLLPVYRRFPVEFKRGEGVYLYTEDGTRYLDFASGIAVNAFGHNHPYLNQRLKDQLDRLWHVSNLYQSSEAERLASRLIEHSFGSGHAFFTNSGAEANETAFKICRRYHDRHGAPQRKTIVSLSHAFHGRTLATLAATGNPDYLDGFDPIPGGFVQIPVDDLDALDQALSPTCAAIIVEVVQGEGGVNCLTQPYLEAIRTLSQERGILMIIDDIQAGMGRTGTLFSYSQFGITPDLLTLAKGLGGGFPIGACLVKAPYGDGMTLGSHGNTFGGNALATCVGNAVLDLLLEPNFLPSIVEKGHHLADKMQELIKRMPHQLIGMSGMGLMRAFHIQGEVLPLVQAALEEGLLIVPTSRNRVRILPPLIITLKDIDEGIARMERALTRL